MKLWLVSTPDNSIYFPIAGESPEHAKLRAMLIIVVTRHRPNIDQLTVVPYLPSKKVDLDGYYWRIEAAERWRDAFIDKMDHDDKMCHTVCTYFDETMGCINCTDFVGYNGGAARVELTLARNGAEPLYSNVAG